MFFIKRSTLISVLALALLIFGSVLICRGDTLRTYVFSLAIIMAGCSIMVMVYIEDVLMTILETNAVLVNLPFDAEPPTEEKKEEEK